MYIVCVCGCYYKVISVDGAEQGGGMIRCLSIFKALRVSGVRV